MPNSDTTEAYSSYIALIPLPGRDGGGCGGREGRRGRCDDQDSAHKQGKNKYLPKSASKEKQFGSCSCQNGLVQKLARLQIL